MKRVWIVPAIVAAAALMPVLLAPDAARAQQPGTATSTPAPAPATGPAPRMPDGRPDLSGVWWTGGDVGGRGFGGGRGRGGGRGAPGGPPQPTFTSLYTPAAAEAAKQLDDNDDPTLECIPTAFGTLNVSLFDVGAVGRLSRRPSSWSC